MWSLESFFSVDFPHCNVMVLYVDRILLTFTAISSQDQLCNSPLTCLGLCSLRLESDAKKLQKPKTMLIVKNPQFYSNQANIQALLPTHELVILTKLHDDRAKSYFTNTVGSRNSHVEKMWLNREL